jgi:hypothetical protein
MFRIIGFALKSEARKSALLLKLRLISDKVLGLSAALELIARSVSLAGGASSLKFQPPQITRTTQKIIF